MYRYIERNIPVTYYSGKGRLRISDTNSARGKHKIY